MTDWQVGDLAVCVSRDPIRHSDPLSPTGVCTHRGTNAPANGVAMKVVAIRPAIVRNKSGSEHPCGCVSLHFESGLYGVVSRFRKVVKDKHEACEVEFIELLNRSKRKVGA